MSTEPPPPVNPYAPSEELAHGDEPAREPAPAVQRRPSRALAIIFSVITYPLAGVGLYVLGRRNAVAWVAAALGVYAAMIASVIARAPAAFLVAFALTLIVWLSAIVNTCVARPGAAPPRIGKALLAVVLAFVAAAGVSSATRKWLIEAYQVPAAGMMPTLLVGDHIMIAKTKRIVAGDVVVFRYPLDRNLSYVKRAIAVGGQTIEVRDGAVLVDGVALRQLAMIGDCPSSGEEPADVTTCRLLQESAGTGWYPIMRYPSQGAPDFPRSVVPPGHLFVLGDNRDNSSDSRVWGPVRHDLVEGRATFVWWSRAPDGGMRWNRLGRKID